MPKSIPLVALAIAFALPLFADARPHRAPVAPVPPQPPGAALAPMPPLPPQPPGAALAPMPPLPPQPPGVAFAVAPPAPPALPPGASFSFSFGKGRLGVHVSSMTGELRRFFGAPEDSGLLVQGVETDTPASKAGVSVGDVIIVVDGDAIDDVGDVAEALSDRNGGDVVDIVIIRGKKRRELRAELRDDAHPGFSGGAFPGGGVHVFGGDDALRGELEEVRQRLQRLEQELGHRAPPSKRKPGVRPKAKIKPTKSDPKKT